MRHILTHILTYAHRDMTLCCRSGKYNECVVWSCCMDPPRNVKQRETEKCEKDKEEEKENEKDKEEEKEQEREREKGN